MIVTNNIGARMNIFVRMNLKFNKNGYLIGNEPVIVDLQIFQEAFVAKFPIASNRHILYQNYLTYIEQFNKVIFPYFESRNFGRLMEVLFLRR